MDAFWSLGFASVKPLEVLLTRDDVTLYDVLDDRNLFNECREQNPKLIAYLAKRDNLSRLLQFVMDVFDDQSVNRSKFQHIATEVLCLDIDAFVDACLANDDELLKQFWKKGMSTSRDEENNLIMTNFCKVFVAFLIRKPHKVFTFIQKQDNALQEVLYHLEMPQVADMLLKVLLLDREPTNEPVVSWLCEQGLMKQLVCKLSAENDIRVHQPALELIKNVILMSSFTPTPGRKEASVLSSNRLSRDLVSPSNSAQLIANLFPSPPSNSPSSSESHFAHAFERGNEASVSSFMCTAAVVMELIRKNNSDYFEQYLFLRAREHLMAVQETFQQEQQGREGDSTDVRPVLEAAMDDIMEKCGLVNLGTLISEICDRMHLLQERLKKPHSSDLPIPTTVGPVIPLTAERLRVCELYGELLHYSNMLLPNRIPGTSPSYDEQGKLIGGLDALGDLAQAMMAEADPEIEEEDDLDEPEEEEEKFEQPSFPVSQQNRKRRSFASDTDSDSMFNEEIKQGSPSPGEPENLSSYETSSKGSGIIHALSAENMVERLSLVVPGSPSSRRMSATQLGPGTPPIMTVSKAGSTTFLPIDSEAVADSEIVSEVEPLSPGDQLKTRFLELGILNGLMDLVFRFPWNNFLHSVVYDILHQVLFGKVEGTLNRELIISLFRDVRLPQRVLDAQAKNDGKGPSEPRLGYMGHMALIAVDIVSALEKYPDDLLEIVEPLVPQPTWEDYVHGTYAEQQRVENIVLGGPKPMSYLRGMEGPSENGWGGDWNDEDPMSPTGELKRGTFSGRQTADFGPLDEEDEGNVHFGRTSNLAPNAWGSSSSSDSEDEHEAWIKHSADASASAAASRHSRDPENVGFDDSFGDAFRPIMSAGERVAATQEEDDGFGAFTHAESTASNQFANDFANDDFDFGEFQSSDRAGRSAIDDFTRHGGAQDVPRSQ